MDHAPPATLKAPDLPRLAAAAREAARLARAELAAARAAMCARKRRLGAFLAELRREWSAPRAVQFR